MNQAQLFRLSGIALVVGAVLSIISTVVSGALFPNSNDLAVATNPLNIGNGIVGSIGTFLALLGLPGLYLRRAEDGGVMWLLGVVLIALTGVVFGVFLGLTSALVFPALATQAPALLNEGPPPSFFAVFIVGGLANLVGAVLMGLPMLTRHIYPRWCGWLMMVEAVFAAASFVVNGPSSSGVISLIFGIISPLPLFVVLGWIGYELWTDRLAAAGAVSGVVQSQPA